MVFRSQRCSSVQIKTGASKEGAYAIIFLYGNINLLILRLNNQEVWSLPLSAEHNSPYDYFGRLRELLPPITQRLPSMMATNVDAKLLKQTKFPPEFNQKVDMQRVNVEVLKK